MIGWIRITQTHEQPFSRLFIGERVYSSRVYWKVPRATRQDVVHLYEREGDEDLDHFGPILLFLYNRMSRSVRVLVEEFTRTALELLRLIRNIYYRPEFHVETPRRPLSLSQRETFYACITAGILDLKAAAELIFQQKQCRVREFENGIENRELLIGGPD
ncbi:unnamed protein product [Cylicocyclus nassatus]|uniref:Uncharacterized protein n=1 Tax=Cylicocyclus nassatus TaxID=53992 RepID=A0AA36GGF7_CYLNA|nr:unnamed protein product [Cylicocyclus nassatus]